MFKMFLSRRTISDDILNCEYEGILGTIAGIVGTMQANEILKKILNIGKNFEWIHFNFRFIKFKL